MRSWETDVDIETVLKALADANRIKIIELVRQEGHVCARDVLDELDITQPTLSHHMKVLTSCGIIISEKNGRWRRYRVNEELASKFLEKLSSLLVEG